MRSALIYSLMLLISFCAISGEIEKIRGKYFPVAKDFISQAPSLAVAPAMAPTDETL